MKLGAVAYAASLSSAARSIPPGLLGDDDNPLVTVYIESWSVWERKFLASTADKLLVNRDLPYRKLAINHAFTVQNHDDCSLRTTDKDADSETPDSGYGIVGWDGPWDGPEVAGMMGSLMTLKKSRPDIILLPSIGGWSRSQEFQHCIQEENRAKFADAIIQHIKWLGLDGVDFDWEYPSCEGGCGCQGEDVCSSTPNKAGHGDWEVYKSFLTYLRQRLDTAGDELGKYLYVTMALGMNPDLLEGKGKWDVPTPFDFLCADDSPVDWMNLMSYDFFGPWAALTGPLSPLGDTPGVSDDDRMNIKYGLDYIKQHCKNMHKLTMGLATYGKSWAGVPKQGSPPGMWQQASANPITGDGTYSSSAGTLSIWDIVGNYRGKCTEAFDEVSQSATMFCDTSPKGLSNVFINYESGEVWKRKMAMARSYGMSGAIIWAASDFMKDNHDASGELLGGLFSGWTGRTYTPPAVTGPTAVTRLKQWPNYPCPIAMENQAGCTVSGSPTLTFPSDETVNLAGSSGMKPTTAPTSAPVTSSPVTPTSAPATSSSTTSTSTTSSSTGMSSTSSSSVGTTNPNGGATSSTQATNDIIADCQSIISCNQSMYVPDCKAKCQYYATQGSCKCSPLTSGSSLAQCVHMLHNYCTVVGGSTPTPSAAPSTASSQSASTGGTCENMVKGIASHNDEFCKTQCPNYVIGGSRELWCSGATPEAQAQCVVQEWASACQLA